MIQKIKIFISIVLPVFLFLPLGSCERRNFKSYLTTSYSTQKNQKVLEDSSTNTKKTNYFVIAENISISSPTSWLPIFLFFWPLPMLLIKNRFNFKSKWKKRGINFLEFLFISSSTGYIFFFTLFLKYKATKESYIVAIKKTVHNMILIKEKLFQL